MEEILFREIDDIKEYALFECDIKLSNSQMTWFEYSFRPYAIMEGTKKRTAIFNKGIAIFQNLIKIYI